MNVHFELQPADTSVSSSRAEGIMTEGFSAWVSGSPTRWEQKVESVGWCEIMGFSPTFEDTVFQWWSSEGEIPKPKDHILLERLLHTYAVEYYNSRG